MRQSVEIRQFFTKHSHNQQATASAYYETQALATDDTQNGTKLSVQLFGPMQLQATQNTVQSEGCQIKVQIEFADENQRVLLDQMPILNDTLNLVRENMPTESVA